MKSLVFLFVLCGCLSAQVSSGSFYGQVLDDSGASIANARISARQETTGFTRTVVSNGSGMYRLPDLAPGRYSISVERTNFRTEIASGLVLEINQEARLDFHLKVGSAHDSINVTALVSPIQTEDNSEGYRLSSAMFSELPLDQRDVLSLVTLGPGAIPRQLGGFVHDSDNDVQQGTRGSVELNPPINGGRASMNAFLVDGGYDTDRNTFAPVIIPPLDSVQEFRIQSSLAGAAFAQAGGAVIDIATKSGSRSLHGSLFELFRNEATDAHNFFDDPTLPRPIFRRNQFGGSLGGPLPLPSTFFFVAYEGLRSKSAKPAAQIVPDEAFRQGNFQGDGIIYDPLSLDPATGQRTPFAGNLIPARRIDPVAAKFLAGYEPLPNRAPGSATNYLDTTPTTNHNDSISGRIDHQFRGAGLLFGRYTINDERGNLAGNFPLRPTSEQLRTQQVVVGHTIAGAHWLNDVRGAFTRLRLFDTPVSAFQQNVAAELGIANPPPDPFAFGLPYFNVTDFATVTDDPTLPQTQRDNTWSLSNTFSLVRGRSTWTLGGEWSDFQLNYQQSERIRGEYDYNGAVTAGPLNATGEPFADFLLGFPEQTERQVGSPLAYLRQHIFAAYLQHQWQATSNLSINVGVRYEYDSPFTEARNRLLNLDYSNLPSQPRLIQVHDASNPNQKNFAPRVGVAWRLPGWFSHGQTVFRVGYGIYFSPEIAVEAYDLVLNGVLTQMNETAGTGLPVLTTENGFPNTSSVGFPSYYGLDQHAPTPYVQQWNAGFQHEFPAGIVLELSYAGSKGTELGLFRRFNTALHTETGEDLNPRPGDLQLLRTFPDLGTLFQRQHIANSSYNSFQAKAEKRFHKSLTFLTSYVWSKSIDDADNVNIGLFDSVGAQNENNLHLERGLSFFDVPRRVSGGFVYSLPQSPLLERLLSNWQISGVFTIQDGTPINIFYIASDIANSGTPNRPNIVPGQSVSLLPDQRTAEHWFNTAAFSTPAPYTFGNAGRDIVRGPGNEVTDIALHRRFTVTERHSIELRAEAFNIFNHPNFGIPGPYPDAGPLFGAILATGEPRRLQFGARLEF
ncbi:MAG: TonB-dependent receptor [Acidobacteriaceae bacterium]|nr:TonB-dependent receptor [Acidobacteriaceae bacterium]